ncbi:hypothetical protein [Roseateles sp.]|uniref:hypothetical protein n=1 Tax=Roseateles sp. TaxID=1971397 RepID=UPI0039E93575
MKFPLPAAAALTGAAQAPINIEPICYGCAFSNDPASLVDRTITPITPALQLPAPGWSLHEGCL